MSAARKQPSARSAAMAASDHLERSEQWNGLRSGDPVVVSGIPHRSSQWEFRAHVRNRNNGSESVEVLGGRPGDRRLRSFSPDRIYAVSGRKGKQGSTLHATVGQLSLAEAPQLPLG